MKLVSLHGIVAIAAVLSVLALESADAAAGKADFRIAYFTIDRSGTPHLLKTDLFAFLYSTDGRAVAGAIAEYFKVNPTQVNAYITAARGIQNVVTKKNSEETSGYIAFDSRYSICKVVAAGPVTQVCGSQISMTIGGADSHQVSYSTKVPAKNMAGGSRCSVEAKFVALTVRRELKAKSLCAPVNDQVIECVGDNCAFGPGVKHLL